jgi:hypothetical protein
MRTNKYNIRNTFLKGRFMKRNNGFLFIMLTAFFLSVSFVTHSQTMSISTATITVAPQAGTAVDLSQNPGSTAGAVANGFLLPYLTTTQMNAISSSAPAGLLIFNSTVNCYEIYSGVVWNPFWCLCSGVPSITAGAVSTSVCTGSTISLTSSGGASTYSWTGPNGFTSTLQNPTIANAVLADAGTYSVTASNGCGSSPVSTVTISVSAGTTVTAGVSASPICAGGTINLTCTSGGGGATYSWTGPNGFSSASQNPSIASATTAATGTYTVICTEGTCSESSTISVVVNPIPTAPSAISEIDPLTNAAYTGPCAGGCIAVGQTLYYQVTNTAGYTYTWAVANGTITSGQGTNKITVSWTGAGTNEITVTQTLNSCTGPASDLFVTVSSTCSCTYTSCAASGTYTVPSGITSLTLIVAGAEGGGIYSGICNCSLDGSADGSATFGAQVTCTYPTTAGTVLNYYVGCRGGTGTAVAAGAGGAGGNADENGAAGGFWAGAAAPVCSIPASEGQQAAGGGGGASDIRVGGTAHANIIVCGGGGGGDYVHLAEVCPSCESNSGSFYCANGHNLAGIGANPYATGFMGSPASATSCGGNTTGASGGYDKFSFGTEGATGATVAAAGTGAPASDMQSEDMTGGTCTVTADAHCPGTPGSNGSNGNGGAGGKQGIYAGNCGGVCEYSPGGGGGGGYFGGGGGCGGGGGGGSSYAGAGTSGVSYTQCSQSGNGSITITW